MIFYDFMKYDVYGIGNPLIDINVNVKDADLAKLGLNKGIMHLIDKPTKIKLSQYISNENISS